MSIKDVPKRHLLRGGLEGGSKNRYQESIGVHRVWTSPRLYPWQGPIPHTISDLRCLFHLKEPMLLSVFEGFAGVAERGGALTINWRMTFI